jgi:putative Mg2+ transporter-C (MgtC) family protein
MEQEYIIRLLVAALITGLIGLEREYRDKSAGFRTLILIGVGSALFTILSLEIGKNGGDPTKIASAIVSGVGFLGAGVIIKDGLTIKGLTTSASIWLTAALGMGIGAGHYLVTIAATLIILFSLIVLPLIEYRIDDANEHRQYEIIVNDMAALHAAEDAFQKSTLKTFQHRRAKRDGKLVLIIKADGHRQEQDKVIDHLIAQKGVISIT